MYHYEEDYEDYEETDGQPVRTRSSARHYQPAQQPRIVDQYNDDEYEYVPATRRLPITDAMQRVRPANVPARRTASRPPRTQPPVPVEQPPVPRQRTYQPPVQTTRQPDMSRRSFLGITRRGLFQTAAVVGSLSLVGLGLWGRSGVIHMNGQLQEGQYAATSISLLCGHNDNSANQTQLHAYLQPDGKINVIEIPGGNPSKAHLNQTQSVRENGYSGNLADLYLSIEPVLVGKHKYQIHLHVEMHEVAVFPGSFSQDWILIDSGKGYFEAVNSK